nr:hypothetical protein [uncultured Hyphomonas sp.]
MRPVIFIGAMLSATVLMVSACATNPADCNAQVDQGFLTKMGCVNASGYRMQTERMRLELEDAKEVNANLKDVYAALEKERNEVRDELAADRAEYQDLTKAMNTLLATLKKNSANNVKLQLEIDKLNSSMNQINQTGGGDSVLVKRQQLDSLQRELQMLETELGISDAQVIS